MSKAESRSRRTENTQPLGVDSITPDHTRTLVVGDERKSRDTIIFNTKTRNWGKEQYVEDFMNFSGLRKTYDYSTDNRLSGIH